MSLLSICTQAANYAQLTAPTNIVSNSDPTALLLLASASLAGQAIARRPEGGWVSQIREYDFTTQASATPYTGTVSNSAPGAMASMTIFSGSQDPFLDALDPTWIVSGLGLNNNTAVASVTNTGAPAWTYTITLNQAAAAGTGGAPIGGFIIGVSAIGPGTGPALYSFGKSDYLLPSDFQRPIDNTFWDRSRFWSMRGPQSPQQWQLYKSSVIGRASIQRRYRFRYISGKTRLSIDPTPFDKGAALVFEYVSNAWCESAAGTPQSTWQADTDIGVIDEYLIELETIWRVLRRLGLSYSEELGEAERQIDKAVATDGAAAILDMTPNDSLTLIGPWNLPESGFGANTGLGPP